MQSAQCGALFRRAISMTGKAALLIGAVLILAGIVAGCEGEAEMRAIEQRVGKEPPNGHPLPSREDYYGVAIANKNSAWVVGSYGTILHITDDGNKVTLQKSGTRLPLFTATASGPNDCMVAGALGHLLRTTDGGKHWVKVDAPKGFNANLLGMARGKNPSEIWAVGPNAHLIHSSDDGKTWVDESLHRSETLNDVYFTDDMNGWVIGELGVIKHTTDGGKTWTEMDKVQGLPPYFQDVTPRQAYLLGIPKLREQDLYLFSNTWTGPNTGYISSTGGLVLKTTNGGALWQAMPTGTQNNLFSIATPPGHPPVVVGILGTLAHEENNQWVLDKKISNRIYTWLRTVRFSSDGSLGIISGGGGTILISRDGGATWKMIDKKLLAAAGNVTPAAKS